MSARNEQCRRCRSRNVAEAEGITSCLECGAYADGHHTPGAELPGYQSAHHVPLMSGRPGYGEFPQLLYTAAIVPDIPEPLQFL